MSITASAPTFSHPFWNCWNSLHANDRRRKTKDGGEIIVIKLDEGGYEVRTYLGRDKEVIPCLSELSARTVAEIKVHAKGGLL